MKKIVALLLALVLVFGLAACGTNNNAAPSNGNNSNQGGEQAVNWPGKGDTITVLVPQDASSQVALSTQILVDWLNKKFPDAKFVMECNAAGAGAATVEQLYKEGADGSYILSGGSAQILSYKEYTGSWEYNLADTDKFIGIAACIGQKTNSGGVFLTKPDSPFNTIAEFVDYVKANPGKVNVGYANGTPHELRLKLITEFYGISGLVNWTPLPNADIIVQAQNGQVDLTCITEVQAATNIEGGKLKGIFNSRIDKEYTPDLEILRNIEIATEIKDPATGNTVTFEQADSLTLAWPMIMYGNAKMDRAKIDILNKALGEINDDPEFVDRIKQRGSTNEYPIYTVEEINAVIQDANETIKKVVDSFKANQTK